MCQPSDSHQVENVGGRERGGLPESVTHKEDHQVVHQPNQNGVHDEHPLVGQAGDAFDAGEDPREKLGDLVVSGRMAEFVPQQVEDQSQGRQDAQQDVFVVHGRWGGFRGPAAQGEQFVEETLDGLVLQQDGQQDAQPEHDDVEGAFHDHGTQEFAHREPFGLVESRAAGDLSGAGNDQVGDVGDGNGVDRIDFRYVAVSQRFQGDEPPQADENEGDISGQKR